MAKEGRERLVSLFSSLSEQVCEESGFTVPDKVPLVTFAPESSALGAYFRLCASEDTRGGFMVLDIGACTADISLFLRGREQAIRTCQIPLGIHYMLLPSLLRNPGLLQADFGFINDPSFRQDLNMLEQIMNVRFTLPILSGIGLFVLIMLAFYIGLCKNYTKLVYEE